MIRASVGLSTHEDGTRAVLEAASQVSAGLGGLTPDWCVAFVTPEHGSRPARLLEALSGAFGTPYVVGCSAAGVLARGREIEQGPAVGVLAVASDQIRATPFLFRDEGDHGLTAGIRAGQRLVSSRGTDDMLLVWPDPFHVRPDRLVQSLDAVLDGVPVAGGAASARGPDAATFQFSGDRFERNAVSGLRLGGRFRHRVGITQGCRPLGPAARVTRAHGSLILELDGRRPLDVLREQAPLGMLDDPERAFNFLFAGIVPDLGAETAGPGDYLVRNILSVDPDDGVVAISDQVEDGQLMLFALRAADSAREDMSRMLAGIRRSGTGVDYRFGLYFNCLARGRSLYGTNGTDAELLEQALPDLPLLGFFCNAEIGPLGGLNHLFTYTGVLVLFAE